MFDFANYLPEIASSFGAEIDHMLVAIHTLMLLMLIVWGFFYGYSLIRYRGAPQKGEERKPFPFKWLAYVMVLAVAVTEFTMMFTKDIPFWIDLRTNFPAKNESLQVRVVAEQFAWNFHYTGPDGRFGKVDAKLVDSGTNPLGLDPQDPAGKDDFYTINQLYVPLNRNVIVSLTSKDVIHSFGLPHFRVKQDAIPGENIPLWFKSIKTGQYTIACSQLCGIGHYRMKGTVNVKPAAEFDQWYADQVAAKQNQGPTDGFWN